MKTLSAFARSISFPILRTSKPCSPSHENSHPGHIRSTSLPCRFHPLVSQLNDAVRDLRHWHSNPSSSLAWLVDGLVRLDHLHDCLSDLLQLHNTQNTLRGSISHRWTERLLEDFLRLADVHCCFRSSVVSLQQHHSATQVAIRTGDAARIIFCARTQRQAEKEISELTSIARHFVRSPTTLMSDEGVDTEMAGIMREVTVVTATTSAAVFVGIAAASCATSVMTRSWWLKVGKTVKRRMGRGGSEETRRWKRLKEVHELEDSLRALEDKSGRVFRSLVNTRVSLLNILSPCF